MRVAPRSLVPLRALTLLLAASLPLGLHAAAPGATVTVLSGGTNAGYPDVAVLRDASGDYGFAVTWTETVGGAPDIRSRVVNLTADPQGTASSFNVQTANGQGNSLVEAAATSLTNGRFAGVWRDYNGTNYEVSYNIGSVNRSTYALSRLSDDRRVNVIDAPGNMNVALAQLTGGANDGAILFVYALSDTAGSNYYLRFRAINDAGTAVIAETSINASGLYQHPAVTALPNGRFAIAYMLDADSSSSTTNDRTIRLRIYNADGTPSGSEITASSATAVNRAGCASALLSDGSLALSWRTATNPDQEIYFRIYDVSGATPSALTAETVANDYTTGGQSNQHITAFPKGGFAVGFNSLNQVDASSSNDVYHRVFDNRGNAAVNAALVNTTTAGAQANPSLAAADDRLFIAWQEGTTTIAATHITAINPIVDLDKSATGTAYASTLNAQADGVAIADSDATLTEPNGDQLQSVTVTISNRLEGANEVLVLASATGLTVTGSGTGTLTLTNAGSATTAQFETALKAVRYQNFTAANTAERTITVTATDTTSLSHSATASVSIQAATPGAATAPAVSSPTSASITHAAATLGGDVTSDGGATVTERGVVYSATSANANPLIGGSGVVKLVASGTTGSFTTAASGLSSSTNYTFKAYATNSVGTSYTTASSFATAAPPDTTPPTLTVVSISSDNASSTWAKLGDTLTLTFTADEAINTPTVTLAGRSASVGLVSGNTWSATLTVNDADPEGLASLAIAFSDLANNAGAAVTATTDSSAVTIDKTAPVITSSGAASGTYRTAFSFSVTASGSPSSFGATGLPSALSINPATGTITGTPTQSGLVTATVTATDAAGNTGSGSLDISLAQAGLTVIGVTAQNKTYDATVTATLDLSAASLTGVLGGDGVTLDTTSATAAFASPDVGAAKPVTISGLALSGSDATHYTLTQPAATADISAATLTVTADNQTRPYGYANQTLTAAITGFVGGETPALLSGAPQLTTAATIASLPGPYTITVDLGTLSAPNYAFVAVDGTLTVRKLVYADWRAENFDALELAEDAISGPLADPDFDGISNLAEFAFDTDPHSGASGPASLSYVGPLTGGGALETTGHPVTLFDPSTVSDFRAVFIRCASAYTAGLTYNVVFSADLVTWTPVVETPTILATDGLLEVVSIPYPTLFNNGEARAFFRVQVQNVE